MDQQGLLASVRRRLRDVWPEADQVLWEDEELIDDYANAARDRLFLLCRNLIIDSTTADDGAPPTALPVCRIAVKKDVATYVISPKVIEISRVKLASQSTPLVKVLQSQLDAYFPNWQTNPAQNSPYGAWCPDLDSDSITIFPTPAADDTALLTVSRFPLQRLKITDNTIPLGFREEYHEDLIPWILYLAFSKKDPETNLEHSAQAEYQRKLFMDRASEIKMEVQRRLTVNHTITPKYAFR